MDSHSSCEVIVFDVVHLSDDNKLYTLENVAVQSYETTIGELWSDIDLTATKMSVRKL